MHVLLRQWSFFDKNGPYDAFIHHLVVKCRDRAWYCVGSYFSMVFGPEVLIQYISCTVAMETQEWERLGLQAQVPFSRHA